MSPKAGAAWVLAILAGAAPAGSAPGPEDALGPLLALIDSAESAWSARDAQGYLALWRFPSPAAREAEADYVGTQLAGGSSELDFVRPASVPEGVDRAQIGARIASIAEPRGAFRQVRFVVSRQAGTWHIVGREEVGTVDGLLHLALDPAGFRANGLTLRLEDFELQMRHGTLFLTPASVGPTVLVFVGEGRVRVSPRPATERAQLRQFCGSEVLEEDVKNAFVRLHPADLHRTLDPITFEPDPEAARRLGDARDVFDEHVGRSFVLDAPLPGSPWWVLPPLGNAMVTFETRRRGTLTFAVDRGNPETLSLFDRSRRRQICLYPAQGGSTRYSEDNGRSVDVVSHDLSVRFEPDSNVIEGRDTLRLQLLASTTTLRLSLAAPLDVRSVTTEEGEPLLFFRVRHQDGVLVSLGSQAGRLGELSLTVSYGGQLRPAPVQDESLQIFEPPERASFLDGLILEQVLVYSSQRSWYPQAYPNDYATARLRFDVPAGDLAVSGGRRVSQQTSAGRTRIEYAMERPAKYLTVAVGRLARAATGRAGPVTIETFAVPRLEKEARETTQRAADILEHFTQEYGPFPYPELRLALIEGETPGGHSPPGMVLVQRRPLLVQGALRDDPASFWNIEGFFLAHEIAHQWWGHAVAGENYHERWLSEALAQYGAALWARHTHGERAFQSILKQLGRWATRYSDKGPISLGYRLGHVEGNPQVFRAVVYDKGAYVLHMLRAVVGPESFRAALTSLQRNHRFDKIGTDELIAELEYASGRELRPYADAWVRDAQTMVLNWWTGTQKLEERYRTLLTVQARNVPGPIPVEVRIDTADGEIRKIVEVSAEGGRFEFDTARKPKGVELNEDRGLLAEVRRR